MALVVETGTGSATAESLASVAAADARADALGNAAWPVLSTAVKEQRLRKTTNYMRQAFRGRWTGCRVSLTQAQDFPRYGMCVDGFYVPSDSVPVDVVNACIDLAFDANVDELNPNLTRGVVRKKIGPLETEFDRYSPQSVRYVAVNQALAPYLKGASANATLVRA